MKRTTKLTVSNDESKVKVTIQSNTKYLTKDDSNHKHKVIVEKIHHALCEKYFAQDIKVN